MATIKEVIEEETVECPDFRDTAEESFTSKDFDLNDDGEPWRELIRELANNYVVCEKSLQDGEKFAVKLEQDITAIFKIVENIMDSLQVVTYKLETATGKFPRREDMN